MFQRYSFYILDEPSAALDPITKNNIFYHKIDTMCKNKGAIMISHRLSEMRYMNRILGLCDGKIAENGTHRELLDKEGIYADMYLKQSSRYS